MELAKTTKDGGQILVESLRTHGIDTAFTVPGESFLPVLDAMHAVREKFNLIVCRHECGAANMAEATGKLTGLPGIAFVTRGPGATHASIAVHTAYQDSTPLILFIGQVPRCVKGREAFQEIDYVRMFSSITKWTAEIDDASRIPEMINRAFQTALSGRQGPVVLALPEDILDEAVNVAASKPHRLASISPAGDDMHKLRHMLGEAQRPLMIVGGSGWDSKSAAAITEFAQNNNLPTGASFRRQDIVDNTHDNYVGAIGLAINPKLAQRVKDADLLLAVGTRLGDATTSGYTLVDIPNPKQKLVHVLRGAEELGRVYQADLPILAGMDEFSQAANMLEPVDTTKWADWASQARRDYIEHLVHQPIDAPVNLGTVISHLRQVLPPEAIITNGAGNFAVWAHRFYQFRQTRTQLAPTNGAMGYGVPAAIAAKIAQPDTPVICVAGDGDFLMTGQELATAKRHNANVIILIVNNGMLGTIRMHQERHYPGNVYATNLENPDFVAFARSFGAYGERVETDEAFGAAFERAMTAGKPAVLELITDPEFITPQTTITKIRNS